MTPTRRFASAVLAGSLALGLLAAPVPVAGQISCDGLTILGVAPPDGGGLFADGFEVGDTSRWGTEPAADVEPVISTRLTDDLRMVLGLAAGTRGEHLVELRVRMPGGDLYQSLVVPIDASSARERSLPAVRRVADHPFPVPVQSVRTGDAPGRALRAGDAPAVVVSLPVAGSLIATSSLHGVWSAEAFVDGRSDACASSAFTLRP